MFLAFAGFFIGFYLAERNVSDVYFFILLLLGLSAVIFLPSLASTAKTEWIFTENGILIKGGFSGTNLLKDCPDFRLRAVFIKKQNNGKILIYNQGGFEKT